MNVEETARMCHEVNRAYCQSLGDFSQVSWSDAFDWQKESSKSGVRLHLGGETSPRASHENWLKYKELEGWVYGEVKDAQRKIHPCMVSYDELPADQQTKDYLFKAVVDTVRDMSFEDNSEDLS